MDGRSQRDEPSRTVIRPQPGPQELCLSSPADIVFFGGSAGGGKTWSLLLEPLRHVGTAGFSSVIFRRTGPQITSPGGLWDQSVDLYTQLSSPPVGREYVTEWEFSSGAVVKFSHMEHPKNRFDWQGSQLTMIGWDELTHFTRSQFFYLLSRNRSLCGVRPYIRATMNPVPPDDPVGGWVHEFVGWYVGSDGYAIPERSGHLRWFVNHRDELQWADDPRELRRRFPELYPKSFTFIRSSVYDNRILLASDPGYLANLMALDNVERERLLDGNWLIKPSAGKVFNRAWFPVVDAAPAGGRDVRFWDFAATEKKTRGDPDFTAGVRMRLVDGILYILDCVAEQTDPTDTDSLIRNVASQDGRAVAIRFEREGGASGKRDARYITQLLAGYDVEDRIPEGDKILRARPFAAQSRAGNVRIVRGPWNESFLLNLHQFPDGAHDDIVDAATGAAAELLGVDGDTVRVVSRRRRM